MGWMTTDYFWKQYDDIPAGMGYAHFSGPHLATLAVLAGLIAMAVFLFGRTGCDARRRVLQGIPLLMVALECGKDLFLLRGGHFGVGYLPLHLCSLGVFVFLLFAASRTEKWQTVFAEIAVTLILPGSVAALLFPDWTRLYPVWNFMNLYGFMWHGLLVLYPLLLIRGGYVHLSIRHIHYDLLFLLCVVPPVLAFDRHFHCNYMFVNWPPRSTPLERIAELTGEGGYLAGYAALAVCVIGLIYLGVWLFADRPRRGRRQRD